MNDEDYLEIIKTKMEKCHHLFIKTKEGEDYYGYHSSDCGHDSCVVICLKCGLTNMHIRMNPFERKIYDKLAMLRYPNYKYIVDLNDNIFKKQFNNAWKRRGKSFDDSIYNLISDEVCSMEKPTVLYDIAKTIKPDANPTELFLIMKKLNEIETPLEKVKIFSVNEAQELIDRYNSVKGNELKLEKKRINKA